MTHQERILKLMLAWQDAKDAGRLLSAKALCENCPELLEELEREIARVEALDRFLEAPDGGAPAASSCGSRNPDDDWPAIPGYEILAKLSEGGQGVVYKARQESPERLVAIKMILPGAHTTEELDRFRQDLQTIGQFQHQNIVRVYGAGEIERRPYFSLEYIDGGSLEDKLDGNPHQPLEAAGLVETIARAIYAAHQRGIVHRDLKPGNILLQRKDTAEGRDCPETITEGANPLAMGGHGLVQLFVPKITDFGLAMQINRDTHWTIQGAIMGTAQYMAPEQAAGKTDEIGPRADIHALGAILYELLTGRPPFQGNSLLDILEQVRTADPVPVRHLQPKVPRNLGTICEKALNKDPNTRYATAKLLADDLRNFLEDRPIIARPAGRIETAWRWCKRNQKLAIASGAAGVSVLLFIGLLLFRNYEKDRALALSSLDRGLSYLEKGEINLGLLWLGRSLEQAPWLDRNLDRVIRTNLSAWMSQCPKPLIVPHGSQVVSMAVSPDGRLAVTGCYKKAILWDVETGDASELPHDHHVLAAAFHPCRKLVVTGSAPQTGGESSLRFWNTETAAEIEPPILSSGAVRQISFNADGRLMLTIAQDKNAKVWDTDRHALACPALSHTSEVFGGAISPDGRLVITCSSEGDLIWLWDTASGSQLHAWNVHSRTRVLTFSLDGQTFASGHDDGRINVWSVNERKSGRGPNVTCAHKKKIFDIRFSWDSKHLLSASADGTARAWDASTGKPVTAPLGHNGQVFSAAWSPDCRYIVTGGDDNTARVWEAASGRLVGLPLQHQGLVQAVRFGQDNTVLTASYDYSARSWKLPQDPPWSDRFLCPGDVVAAQMHPNNKQVLAVYGLTGGAHYARWWDLSSHSWCGIPLELGNDVNIISVAANCSHLAVSSTTDPPQIWELDTGRKLPTPPAPKDRVTAIAFDPKSERMFIATADGEVQTWDVSLGQPAAERITHTEYSNSLSPSPDGARLITGCGGRQANIWDLTTGGELKRFNHHDDVRAVAFSAQRNMIATAGLEKSVHIWNARGRYEQRFLLLHPAGVDQVVFSEDSNSIATACADGGARLWDLVTGRQVGPPMASGFLFSDGNASETPERIASIAFTADQRSLLIARGRLVELWPLPRPLGENVSRIIDRIEDLTVMTMDRSDAPQHFDLQRRGRR
jgi:WD40 repeat protein/serine/threonine protein kinase